jgi:hypothetical protein
MHDNNENWALASLEAVSATSAFDTSSVTVDPSIQAILLEFEDVFAKPTGLPPHCQYDHAIALEPGAQPPNVRPYRYSPLQKDEIERQVADMLKSGVIVHNMSPYAAPVQKDGSWRFCIDFRRLNMITVKNKFPLPIVDELLDELAGAAFFSKLDLWAGYHQNRMRETDEENRF